MSQKLSIAIKCYQKTNRKPQLVKSMVTISTEQICMLSKWLMPL